MLKKLAILFTRRTVFQRLPRVSVLIRTETGFKPTTDYGIYRVVDEFKTDTLLKSGADLSTKQNFSTGDDLSALDNASVIVNEILNTTEDNEK